MDDACALSDGRKSSEPGNPRKFSTDVKPSKKVTWVATKIGENRENYKLSITNIWWEGENEVFGKNLLLSSEGEVSAKVKPSAVTGDEFTYQIYFTITPASGPQKSFPLDPKLKVHAD